MVGHTGIMSAAIQACAVDKCVEKNYSCIVNDYTTIVIADHGNCETMINPTEALIPHNQSSSYYFSR
jgi:2,3-bisphosphoglycerate-independent phosphoglycerate mutase